MAFSRHVPLANIRILATDIDKKVIEHAQVGLYSEKSIAAADQEEELIELIKVERLLVLFEKHFYCLT